MENAVCNELLLRESVDFPSVAEYTWPDAGHKRMGTTMARALTFDWGGTVFQAEPAKLERKKVYGWTDIAANVKKGWKEVA